MLSSDIIAFVTIVTAVLAHDLVVLKQGRLRGHRLTSRRGRDIFAFQGIPYAKPPVGDFRFQPPQPPEPWSGVLDAIKEGSMCVQREMFRGDAELKGSENCLFLNVYTPQLPDSGKDVKPLDVMFWIHGGGFFAGSGNSDMYGPQYLLDKDIILVTINYRLGALGFLSTGDAACPGNNGLKDQVAALRWVRDNIAAFGGNPNSVTIFGESAGGGAVHYHMLSPASKGLFHRGISQSGTATFAMGISTGKTSKHKVLKVAAVFGCPIQTSDQIISCLKKQDAYEIYSSDRVQTNSSAPTFFFQPVIETQSGGGEKFISEDPMQTLLYGHQELVPWITGITSSEGGMLVNMFQKGGENEIKLEDNFMFTNIFEESEDNLDIESSIQKIQDFYFGGRPITNESSTELINLGTDAFFVVPANTAVKLHSRRDAKVYYYYFDYRGSSSFSALFADPSVDYGVIHMDDLIYLFPQDHSLPNSIKTPQDKHMVDIMTTLWVNFAHKGNPTTSWDPVSSPDVVEYAHIDADGLHMGKGLLKERTDFWDCLPIKNKYPTSTEKEEL